MQLYIGFKVSLIFYKQFYNWTTSSPSLNLGLGRAVSNSSFATNHSIIELSEKWILFFFWLMYGQAWSWRHFLSLQRFESAELGSVTKYNIMYRRKKIYIFILEASRIVAPSASVQPLELRVGMSEGGFYVLRIWYVIARNSSNQILLPMIQGVTTGRGVNNPQSWQTPGHVNYYFLIQNETHHEKARGRRGG